MGNLSIAVPFSSRKLSRAWFIFCNYTMDDIISSSARGVAGTGDYGIDTSRSGSAILPPKKKKAKDPAAKAERVMNVKAEPTRQQRRMSKSKERKLRQLKVRSHSFTLIAICPPNWPMLIVLVFAIFVSLPFFYILFCELCRRNARSRREENICMKHSRRPSCHENICLCFSDLELLGTR